jgi:hypothetical protein
VPSLRTLDRRFRPMADKFFRWARARVPGLVVTSAKRSRREQLRLYNEYMAGRNNGLPATPPGHSSHELGLAFDMARPGHDPLSDPTLFELGKAWRAEGGTWWEGDPVHFAASPSMLAPGGSRRTRRRRASRT